MDAKQAIKAAKSYVSDILEDEGLMNLGLEEVKFKEFENCWEITLGFSRPWNGLLSSLEREQKPPCMRLIVSSVISSAWLAACWTRSGPASLHLCDGSPHHLVSGRPAEDA